MGIKNGNNEEVAPQTEMCGFDSGIAQITLCKALPSGNFAPIADTTLESKYRRPFALCNVSGGDLSITAKPLQNDENVTIVLQAGWNPILFKSVDSVSANTLVAGW